MVITRALRIEVMRLKNQYVSKPQEQKNRTLEETVNYDHTRGHPRVTLTEQELEEPLEVRKRSLKLQNRPPTPYQPLEHENTVYPAGMSVETLGRVSSQGGAGNGMILQRDSRMVSGYTVNAPKTRLTASAQRRLENPRPRTGN